MFEGKLAWLRGFRPGKRVIIPALAAVSLFVFWAFDRRQTWVLIWVVVLVVFGFYLELRRRQRYTASHTTVVDNTHYEGTDTAELPLVGRFGIPVSPKKNRREIWLDSTGQEWLKYERHEYSRRHLLGSKEATIHKGDIRLNSSLSVNKHLAVNSSFEPVEDEKEILVFTRLHWVSHAPAQILVVLLYVVLIGMLILGNKAGVLPAMVALGVSVIGVVAAVIAYLWVWIPWAYTWLVVTDQRILLIYDPPVWLTGEVQSILLSQINFFNEFDQHRMFTWLLEKVGLPAYGIIGGDTPAQEGDEWIRRTEDTDAVNPEVDETVRRGLRYVPRFKAVIAILNDRLAAIAQAEQERHNEAERLEQERHEEAMRLQREETERREQRDQEQIDLLRQIAHNTGSASTAS